jgi:hypothetical protein
MEGRTSALSASPNIIMEKVNTFEIKVLGFYSLMMLLLTEWPLPAVPRCGV